MNTQERRPTSRLLGQPVWESSIFAGIGYAPAPRTTPSSNPRRVANCRRSAWPPVRTSHALRTRPRVRRATGSRRFTGCHSTLSPRAADHLATPVRSGATDPGFGVAWPDRPQAGEGPMSVSCCTSGPLSGLAGALPSGQRFDEPSAGLSSVESSSPDRLVTRLRRSRQWLRREGGVDAAHGHRHLTFDHHRLRRNPPIDLLGQLLNRCVRYLHH